MHFLYCRPTHSYWTITGKSILLLLENERNYKRCICFSAGQRQLKVISQLILTYNENMGDVDLHDQHRVYYLVGQPCKKWWRYLFWFFVQSSLINAFIIFKKSNQSAHWSKKMQDPLHFRLAVCDGLVKGNIVTKRQTQMQGSLEA